MKQGLALLLLAFLAVGCSGSNEQDKQKSNHAVIGMANPASQYCINNGGKLEMIQADKGTYAMCHLPNGKIIEEWTYYRSEQQPN